MEISSLGKGATGQSVPPPVATEIAWLRSRRKLATTPEQFAAVSRELTELAHALERRPKEYTAGQYVVIGIAAIALGLVVGVILLFAADAMTAWLQS
ncbi:hypothetical protein QP027_08815 [Corynebacterium breve]|uniref:DUF3040 domain-containing protein n=1 Tax=Corynebacterium breve TaxID=3049799 RepID=A0ABY8VC50_9CORY|nr:hypothetical protein [Corynebacterium breve]WIM67216.1 hypothetical protein QP027_08815 [Corynebacterium breve]